MIHRLRTSLAAAVVFALSGSAYALPPTVNSAFDPASLDARFKPCDDFYDYVNAKWIAANPIPGDRTRWGTFDELREASLNAQHKLIEDPSIASAARGTIEQKLGDFYASGMDEATIEKAGIAPIRPELARIAAIKSANDLAAYMIDAHARGLGGYFSFGAYPDFKNSSVVIGFASEDGLGLPERAYYLEDKPDYVKIRDEYLAHIEKTLVLSGIKTEEARQDAQWIMALETRDAKASLSPIEARDPKNQYHYASVAEADEATPHFSWAKFLAAQGLKDVQGFSLSHPQWFAEFDKMLTEVPVAQWKAYLRFHAIDDAAPFLSRAFVEEHFDFGAHKLRGQKEIEPRWKRVLGAVNGQMGQALGQLYVKENFPPEAKQSAERLVANLQAALKLRIEKLDWMSDATKAKALEKLAAFKPKIGYPDKWRDWTGLAIARTGYVDNLLAASKFNHDWRMGRVGKPVDRTEWGMTPQTVNASYSPLKNEITFPAAILQPPYFDAKADDALNYGGIGAVIGHEITHGFDDKGSQFDAHGNNSNWWTDADRQQFTARADRLVAQFDGYVALEDIHVKGKLTLGENIADLGGLNVAYDALQIALKQNPAEAASKIDGFSQDQRFFLNFARLWRTNTLPATAKVNLNTDPHAPGQFRAIAAPSNMPAFAQAFSCKTGDAMVRAGEAQVKIW
ncbi:MAG: M13 family metallopeptidase [Proteobacteria bacterium]|uniref:M13 family metallopeptidase n=1 Tax=Rudaea sp. TaxID=2136325 RepID=UPI003783334E|nr:M13 family metallopeptidase [Pseudomonadota bacterium]